MWKNYFYSQKYFVNFAVNILNFIKRSLLKYYIINKIKKKYFKNTSYINYKNLNNYFADINLLIN